VSASGDGVESATHRISELIPMGFGPANLADAGDPPRDGKGGQP
jgi:hypothetical protein